MRVLVEDYQEKLRKLACEAAGSDEAAVYTRLIARYCAMARQVCLRKHRVRPGRDGVQSRLLRSDQQMYVLKSIF